MTCACVVQRFTASQPHRPSRPIRIRPEGGHSYGPRLVCVYAPRPVGYSVTPDSELYDALAVRHPLRDTSLQHQCYHAERASGGVE